MGENYLEEFLCSSACLCTHWYSTQSQQHCVHNTWIHIWLFACTSPCHFLSVLDRPAFVIHREPSQTQCILLGLWQFWQNFNIHSPMKYRSVNGFSWQLIGQVRGRKQEEWGEANVERHFPSSCCTTRGMNRENRGICKWGAPINQSALSVHDWLPFLSPNGCGSSVIID